ncbi:MAG TPA: hypothetical protein VJH22_05005 [Candidatus Nanoarchaeia archaeon]|nr:hypothetical protein [Candidatus Nanoarchaeia archaeon]
MKHHLNMKHAQETFKENLEFAKRTEEAWQRHDLGKFKRRSSAGFLLMLKEITA